MKKHLTVILWVSTLVLLLGLLFARAIFPELLWLTVLLALPLLGGMGALVQQNRKALRSRTAMYGLNATITIFLVIGIVGVLNFLTARYPQKLDLTKNKIHTLSDQTVKLVKNLKTPVKATLFAKTGQREQMRPLLDNYKALNPKFEVEYVDPDKELARSKTLGIKKYGTLHLAAGSRESKVEDATEEKLTNALIKLLQEKSSVLCAITGHGEKNFNSTEADGYEGVKKALIAQAYEVRDLNLVQDQKIPESCSAIALVGPLKGFFQPEIQAIRDYLDRGGRAVVALDINIKGDNDFAVELFPVLESWFVKPASALIVDPLSRMLGVDASVPLVSSFAKDHAITRDFQTQCFFPFARPLDIVPGAPSSLKIQWIAQTNPKSWGVTNLSQLAKGQATFVPGKDREGPLTVAVAVDGKQKDSKASRNTRLVVFGSSNFGTNNFARYGGNQDMFLNAVSWVLEDETLISIRAKEEGVGKVELSQKQGGVIFWVTVIIIPLLIAAGGVVVWILRRRL